VTLPAGHYHGETLTTCQLASVRLMENTYPAGLRIPSHSHKYACFSLMLQGSLTEVYGKRRSDWRATSFGFNLADEEHSNVVHTSGARFFIVELGPEWPIRARDGFINLDKSFFIQGGILTWLGFKLYKEARQLDDVSPLAIEGLILEIIAEMSRQASDTQKGRLPNWLRQSEEILHEHFAERLSMSFIAKAVGVHPVHLAKVFRKINHCTVGDYVRRLRVEFACQEISRAKAPLAEIAVRAGFYDQGHFSKTFKRFTGLTPTQYQKSSARLSAYK
jgi:AraC family transcriptional regulator